MKRVVARALARFGRDQSGAAAIEFAVVSTVLVIFCMALVDFGRNVDARSRLAHAADAAARVVFLNASATETQVNAALGAGFPGLGYERMTLRLADLVIGARPFREITVSLPMRFLTPGFTGRSGLMTVRRLVPAA